MNQSEMRIVFMGTPDFAVATLSALLDAGYNVVGVITATDKYGGRGGKDLIESAVKKFAFEKGLKILQPPNLKNLDFLIELRALEATIQVVVAFRLLPTVVWNMPPLGTYNIHASLLPKYRGAAPIHWAIIKGETETGVTSFKLQQEIDTGDVLMQKKISIGVHETTGELYDRLKLLGAEVLLASLELIESRNFTLLPQMNSLRIKAPKVNKENSKIDFHQTGFQVHNFVRGMNPFPGAWTLWQGKSLKVYKVSYILESHNISPGTFEINPKSYLRAATTDGWVELLELQLAGKKRMGHRDFLNGLNN